MTKQTWNDERVEILKSLWGAGKTAAEIASQLGNGITRNAVIGKAHRLGLSGRATTMAPKKIEKTHHIPAAAAALISEPVYERSATAISLLELTESTCRWPLGDPKKSGFHFCGARPMPGVPYCGTHAAAAYQNVIRKVTVREDVDNTTAEDVLSALDEALNA